MTTAHNRNIVPENAFAPGFFAGLAAQGNQLVPADRSAFEGYLERQARIYVESREFSDHLARQDEVLPTARVSSLNDTEHFIRELQAEFGLLSSGEVAEAVGSRSHRSYASDLRKSGRLLGLQRLNKFVFPGFQVADGEVRPIIGQLSALGRQHGMTERDILVWLCVPTTRFRGGARPVDRLDDSGAVLEAAASSWGVIE